MLILWSNQASAQMFQPAAASTRAGLASDIWVSEDATVTVATMAVEGHVSVHKNVVLDAEIPWAFGSGGGFVAGPFHILAFGHKAATVGNPTVGAHWIKTFANAVAPSAGLTISIPTRLSPDDLDAWGLGAFVATSRGLFDMHRFEPENVFIRAPARIEARVLPVLYLRGEITPVIWIPTGGSIPCFCDSPGRRTYAAGMILEQAVEIEPRSSWGLGGGVRLQLALGLDAVSTFARDDHAQAAIEPFVSYEPDGAGPYARTGLLVALDTPMGIGSRDPQLITFRIQGGWKF